VVAVVRSAGLAELFASGSGTVRTVAADDADETALLAAVLGTGAAQVVVLPNDPGLIALAGRVVQRAREEGRDAAVVATRSAVQGLAALAVADPTRRFDDDLLAMAEAAAATRWADVTIAEEEALTSAGRCRPGEVLGSAEGDVVVLGDDPVAVGRDLLDRLLSAGGELATIVEGDGAAPGLADAVCSHLATVHPTVEVVRYAGGPAAVPLLIGVE
jgi:dihydroxyacetone kinase-like predicted kinase